jgi:hypothetical protein
MRTDSKGNLSSAPPGRDGLHSLAFDSSAHALQVHYAEKNVVIEGEKGGKPAVPR